MAWSLRAIDVERKKDNKAFKKIKNKDPDHKDPEREGSPRKKSINYVI